MAQMNFGGVIENVVTREEFPLEKAREVLKNETIAVIGYGVFFRIGNIRIVIKYRHIKILSQILHAITTARCTTRVQKHLCRSL